MNNLKVKGIVLSKIDCLLERQMQAARLKKETKEVPLKYGSMRVGVNLIQFEEDNNIYQINKESLDFVKEERIILEISYKYNEYGQIVDEHDVVRHMHNKMPILLNVEHSYVSPKHYVKFINMGTSQTIKSYFIKCWADKVVINKELEEKRLFNSLRSDNCDTYKFIRCKDVINNLKKDKELIIV